MKVSAEIEASGKDIEKILSLRGPENPEGRGKQIRQLISGEMMQTTPADVLSLEGRAALENRIKERLKVFMPSGVSIDKVYFFSYLVQ